MEQYKKDIIEFMVEAGVLTFGDFTTKSGRKTPFFINTGNYRTGPQMCRLGAYYAAAAVAEFGEAYDVLFGPAYKGIPLCVSTAMALHTTHGLDKAFCFNRKEVKDHGEGGNLVGHRLQDGDRVLIIEDVTTAGTSVRESVPMLKAAADVTIAGLLVSVDRMERGLTERSALWELREEYDMKTASIVNLDDVVNHLHNRPVNGKVVLDDEMRSRIGAYRELHGADYGV